ncbi:MAG: histidinol-phosphatase [Parasporobacterium sp.]|nr:histidinol-phosphatase [Parasporobacterium sp.]
MNEGLKIDWNDLRKTDLHMHTVYCDGKNTPEEMVLSALDKGMHCIGFSGHSYVEFDPSCGMNPEQEAAYRKEIRSLKEVYGDRIRILCGIEMDYHSTLCGSEDARSFDYIIGSVHYLDTPDGPKALDDTPEVFSETVETYFGGDYYLAAEQYFEHVSDVVRRTRCDIIGHFDLITKFNEVCHFFDEQHPRYIAAWNKALKKLIPSGRLFEINTGGISRGWKQTPYPSSDQIAVIREQGGQLILSSDSHNCDTIGFGFNTFSSLL